MQFRSMLLMGGALLSVAAAPAWAQDNPSSTAVSGDTVGPNANEQPPADDGSDIIVITATKRETDLQDTAISIAVLNPVMLENSHVESLLDIASGMPTLRLTTFESRQTALTVGMRGIVPNDANQPAREQGVGVYLDGVYLGRQHGLNASMLDIERIEVLRGPQGTLFGRNTEGGAVNMVTRRPSGELGVRTTFGISNYNGYNGDIHVDLPEILGVSLKFDAATQYHDATTKNPNNPAIAATGQKQEGWNFVDRHGFRVSALWRPLDGFEALYAYDQGEDKNTPFLSQLVNYNPLNLPISSAFPRPAGTISPLPPGVTVHEERQEVADIGVPQEPSLDRTFGHSLHWSWDLGADMQLRSITAYREVEAYQYDNAGVAARPPVFQPNAPANNAARNFSRYSLSDLGQHQRSQEFQLVGSLFDGRMDYVVGLYYFNEKAWEEAATPSTVRWIGSTGAYAVLNPRGCTASCIDGTPAYPGSIRGTRSIDRGSVAWAESSGAYVHTVYTPPILDDSLHITLGGRQTRDEKHGSLYLVGNARKPYNFELTEARFDPTVTVAYDLTSDINVYATYSTGYRAGGANSRSLSYTPFDSEEVTSYELGFKSYLFDALTLNIALFDMDRTNTQVDFTLVAPDPLTGSNRNTNETRNAPGTTELRGVELDAMWEVTDDLQLGLSYAYTDTNVPPAQNPFPPSAACPSCGTVQNVFIIYTPFNAASATLDYNIPLDFADLRMHLDANYSDGTQSFEQSGLETDDSFIVNARLSLADIEVDGAAMTFALWSRNLLDEEHIYRRSSENRSGANALGDYANFNEPRMYGAEVSFKY